MKYCVNCGAQMPDGQKYCQNCGFDQYAQPQQPAQRQGANPLVIWLVMGVVIAVLAVGGVLLFKNLLGYDFGNAIQPDGIGTEGQAVKDGQGTDSDTEADDGSTDADMEADDGGTADESGKDAKDMNGKKTMPMKKLWALQWHTPVQSTAAWRASNRMALCICICSTTTVTAIRKPLTGSQSIPRRFKAPTF